MDRLTARNEAGFAYLVNVKPNEQEVDSPHKNTLKCILNCFERLAQYEDAEQEGRLAVLPCKVGDTVYAIADCADILKDCDDDYYTGTGAITCPFEKDCEFEECDDANRRIFETYVRSIYKDKDEPVNIFLDKIVDRQFYPSDFGKTVFLTREAAEAALKGE
jgi:hypothetical protein